MSIDWKPKRSLAECEAIITAPGSILETSTEMINGRILRVYKNLWPDIRTFILMVSQQHRDQELVVFEDCRLTYQQALEEALKFAGVLRDVYGVKKGDRVAIVSRNYTEYIVSFWATHLIGAVTALVNAWLPNKALYHCILMTKCKVVIADAERALKLDTSILRRDASTRGFVVIRPHELPNQKFPGWVEWRTAITKYTGNPQQILEQDPQVLPDDDATIFFTSGTTGLPKGVLSTQRSFLTNTFNGIAGRMRTPLRNGEEFEMPEPAVPQKAVMISVPLFHVTGYTALAMLAQLQGYKIVLIRKWDPDNAAALIKKENIAVAGGVPSMVADLIESEAAGSPSIEGFFFGGAPAHKGLAGLSQKAFPAAVVSQAYGLTETNAVCISHAGEDYLARPESTGSVTPINELAIVKDEKVMSQGELGEIWIKGVNVMKEYYVCPVSSTSIPAFDILFENDPEATRKAITPDGWFKTGDIGTVDEEGFLYIKDRAKDVIIRGGENIDSVTVENALYADARVLEAAAVGVPDKRLGELVSVAVTLKKDHKGKVGEEELIGFAAQSLAKFAVPVMIVVQDEPLERNPAGKIIKASIRKRLAKEWEKRRTPSKRAKSKL